MNATMAPSDIALRVIGLMAEWRRATASHMALGGGLSCACGSAFDGIAAADLEADLVDYIREKYRGSAAPPAAPDDFDRTGRTGELAIFLRALADSPTSPAVSDILDDLQRAIDGLTQNRRP